MRWINPLIIVVLAGASLAATTQPTTAPAPAEALPKIQQPIPLSDAQGQSMDALPRDPADKAVVLLFITTDCPISNNYAPELKRIIRQYSGEGFRFELIYSDPTQTADAVRQHVSAYGYTCPALLDPQHQLTKAVGATVTPEAAVVVDRQVVYRGRIDNRWGDLGLQRPSATVHDLENALQSIENYQPIKTPLTQAIGCPISD